MEWVVSVADSGSKLLGFLSKQVSGYSAKALKRVIESNRCQINGRIERFASTLVGHGDRIVLVLDEKPSVKFDLTRILLEDEALLVYHKPAGVNCDEQGIVRILHQYHSQLILVHRLDRDTTGVLLFVKAEAYFKSLVEQFKQHQVEKCYQAIVDGCVKNKQGLIENYLYKERLIAGQTIWGQRVTPPGLHAITKWECIKKSKTSTLLTCYPKTGRTHQLRVHLAGMGHPILGDVQYGKQFKSPYQPARYLLHALRIQFEHPVTHQLICIEAPLPQDFKESLKELFEESL